MSDITLVQGDTAPDVTGALTYDDGTAVDLTDNLGIRFQMRKADDRRYTINGSASVVGDPTLGQVSYRFGANELDNPGDYQCQWEVTFSDGRVQTQAEVNTITVRRQ